MFFEWVTINLCFLNQMFLMFCIQQCPLWTKIWAKYFLFALSFNCTKYLEGWVSQPYRSGNQTSKKSNDLLRCVQLMRCAAGIWTQVHLISKLRSLHYVLLPFLSPRFQLSLFGSQHCFSYAQGNPPRRGWDHALDCVLENPQQLLGGGVWE